MAKITIDIEAAKRTLTVAEALDLLRTYDENRKKRIHTFEKSFLDLWDVQWI